MKKPPHPFGWFATPQQISDHTTYANNVVIDVSGMLSVFFDKITCHDGYEHPIDELINDIIGYVSLQETALAGLDILHDFMLSCYDRADCPDGIPVIVANAALELGQELYKRFQHLGLYGDVGVLPYQLGYINFTSLLLVKLTEDNCDSLEGEISRQLHHRATGCGKSF